jgi:hypothetical protein
MERPRMEPQPGVVGRRPPPAGGRDWVRRAGPGPEHGDAAGPPGRARRGLFGDPVVPARPLRGTTRVRAEVRVRLGRRRPRDGRRPTRVLPQPSNAGGGSRILADWPAPRRPRPGSGRRFLAGGGDEPPLGFIVSMEGADPILRPEDVPAWWDAGLRIVSLSHYGNGRYSHGTGTPGPLNEDGPALLAAMQRGRHDPRRDAPRRRPRWTRPLDLFGGVVLASHHNCRALVGPAAPVARRRHQEAGPAGRGGRGGLRLLDARRRVRPGAGARSAGRRRSKTWPTTSTTSARWPGRRGTSASAPTSTAGSEPSSRPNGLDTVADLRKMPDILARRGYSAADIEGVMHGNWLALMRRAWGRPAGRDADDRAGAVRPLTPLSLVGQALACPEFGQAKSLPHRPKTTV